MARTVVWLLFGSSLLLPTALWAQPVGGCTPVSKAAAQCETALAKALGKFVGAVGTCHQKQAAAAITNQSVVWTTHPGRAIRSG